MSDEQIKQAVAVLQSETALLAMLTPTESEDIKKEIDGSFHDAMKAKVKEIADISQTTPQLELDAIKAAASAAPAIIITGKKRASTTTGTTKADVLQEAAAEVEPIGPAFKTIDYIEDTLYCKDTN